MCKKWANQLKLRLVLTGSVIGREMLKFCPFNGHSDLSPTLGTNTLNVTGPYKYKQNNLDKQNVFVVQFSKILMRKSQQKQTTKIIQLAY